MEREARIEAAEAQTGIQGFSDSYEVTLVAWLVARRHVLLGLYILIFGAFLVLFAAIDSTSVFELAHGVFYWLRGDEEPWRYVPLIGSDSFDFRPLSDVFLIMLGIYLALQAAVLRWRRAKPGTRPGWSDQLLARRPTNIVLVAMANKTARVVWAMLRYERIYQPVAA